MKRGGILHGELSHVVAQLGHTDLLAVADAGLPIPDGVRRVDLALVPGVPGFLQTVRALLGEIVVERAVIAQEMASRNPDLHRELREALNGVVLEEVPHEEVKRRVAGARAVVRTGEWTPYANVLLQCGVAF
jgi:D-ribose pyranase